MTISSQKNALIKSGIAVLAVVAMAIPSLGYAATFAYVDHSGDVKTVIANTPSEAIATAPGIGIHSGVLLLDSDADNDLVGDSVSGA